uniref:Selenoprotein W, 2a n=1 Tax=Gasterosteus aculeatus aculeatus TaxID=481459 RepID=A0AAQ4RR74_GASAC
MTGLVPKAVTSQVASSLCSSLHFAGSFEIELNGQLIFSKIELGGFPHEDDVLDAVNKANDGKPVDKITKSRAPCVIM